MSKKTSASLPGSGKYLSLHMSGSAAFLPQELLSFDNERTAKTPGPFLRPEFIKWKYGLSATGSGLPENLPDPILKFKKNEKRPLRDFEGMGSLILLSDNALRILKEYAGSSIDCRSAIVYLCDDDGEIKIEGYSICDVTRFENLLDMEKSALSKGSNPNIYWEATSKIAFLDKPSSDVHLFRLLNIPESVFCSRELAHSVIKAGLTGVKFVDPGV
jgi:hypothetical protein